MEEFISTNVAENLEDDSENELLILHTAEASDWATYMQQILKLSSKFSKSSIVLYAVSTDDQLHGYNFGSFSCCRCIVLLLTRVFLDILCYQELQEALQRLLYPPHRVVALLCGVSEEDVMAVGLADWPKWRKLHAEDEPVVYISTIGKSLAESRQLDADCKSGGAAPSSTEDDAVGQVTNIVREQSKEDVKTEELVSKEIGLAAQLSCVTVQPSRAVCGAREKLFIILTHKFDGQLAAEVEFTSEKVSKRAAASLENEYTLSVTSPDMPPGLASLTLYTRQACTILKPVTFSTMMGEVSRCLENAADPVNFLCQAFGLTSDITESLDNMLTKSFKSNMPATGLQMFGIRQIDEDISSAYQRTEELPTLLHFAAKFGLKKLTSTLLRCPGALQAYSVMNKHGEYPNTLAEKSGFPDLKQFMDKIVETADTLKSHLEEDSTKVCEQMSDTSENMMMKSSCLEDIYESMLEIYPECGDDLYIAMDAVENPEEALLRKFFEGKPPISEIKMADDISEDEEKDDQASNTEEEDGPHNLNPEEIYDTVESDSYNPTLIKRPPAPIPRLQQELEQHLTCISQGFSVTKPPPFDNLSIKYLPVRPVVQPPPSSYDPYAGMKTPGQKQLVCLQERVKVGEITVEEAVQEFKAWQLDHERRADSIRYKQDNLKKLRESINRRHKGKEKTGKEIPDFEISAPMRKNSYWGYTGSVDCAVYEPSPRLVALPPLAAHPIQRANWRTGSTSSTSSTESNRLSTHSTVSSGTEPDFEDMPLNPPPRPPRLSATASPIHTPPIIPPRLPERMVVKTYEHYTSCPTRALPQIPSQKTADSAPPIPRRMR